MGLCQAVNDHRQGAPIPMSHRQGRALLTPCPVKDPGTAPAGHWGTLGMLWQQDTDSVTRVERQQPPITSCSLASAPPPPTPNDQALGGATSSTGPRSQSPWNTALFMEGAPHTPIQCPQLQPSPTTILPHHTSLGKALTLSRAQHGPVRDCWCRGSSQEAGGHQGHDTVSLPWWGSAWHVLELPQGASAHH